MIEQKNPEDYNPLNPNVNQELEEKFAQTLPEDYEEFLKKSEKSHRMPNATSIFKKEDITHITDSYSHRIGANSLAMMTFAISMFSIDRYLRVSNIIIGLTYRFTFLSFAGKFVLVPRILTGFFDKAYLLPLSRNKQKSITDKYDISEPDYRTFYENYIKTYKKTL